MERGALQALYVQCMISYAVSCAVWSHTQSPMQYGLLPSVLCSMVSHPILYAVWSHTQSPVQYGLMPNPLYSMVSCPIPCAVWSHTQSSMQYGLTPSPLCSMVSYPIPCAVWSHIQSPVQYSLMLCLPPTGVCHDSHFHRRRWRRALVCSPVPRPPESLPSHRC